MLDNVFAGNDPIAEVVYTDRYVCSPLVVNLLVNVLYEIKGYCDDIVNFRIQGRRYQKTDSRIPWQPWHDWHTWQERDDAIRQAFEYCGLEADVLSLPTLPHYRQLQLRLRSGKQLTIQFDQGLSFWEAERSSNRHQQKFNFDAPQLGQEVMGRIQCRVEAPGNEKTQIFIAFD